MKRLAFALALLAAPAMAQPETVNVDGTQTLTGLWRISFPGGASGYMPGRGRLYTAGMDAFCRLQQRGGRVAAHCLPGWGPDSGSGELDGEDLHLAWGITLMRAVIDAKVANGSARAFTGAFALKVFGIRHDSPEPASARKLTPDPAAPDRPGKARLVRQALAELAAGAIAMPHEADVTLNFGHQLGSNQANTPEEIRGLGTVETVLYLGEASAAHGRVAGAGTLPANLVIPGFGFSAYQVEFANGERLCGIHQRDDGVMDGFLCV